MTIHSNVCNASLRHFRGVTIVPTYSLNILKYRRWTGEVAQQLVCLPHKQEEQLNPRNSQLIVMAAYLHFQLQKEETAGWWAVLIVSSEISRQSLPQTE